MEMEGKPVKVRPVMAATLPMLPLLWACSSESTAAGDSLLLEFEVRECKQPTVTGALLTAEDTSTFVGLQCVSWALGDDLSVDLINFASGCGFGSVDGETHWKGDAEWPRDSAVILRATWNSYPTACGDCLYDFSYVVTPPATSETMRLETEIRACRDCDVDGISVDLNPKSGVRCQYLDSTLRAELSAGSLHAAPKNGTCASGLIAVDVGERLQVCATACGDDKACPGTGVFECVDGACLIKHQL